MNDHADTIRCHVQSIQRYNGESGWNEVPSEQDALAALDALLAEREQAIDALREAKRELPFTQSKLQLQAETYRDVPLDSCIRDIEHVISRIDAALAKLGETP